MAGATSIRVSIVDRIKMVFKLHKKNSIDTLTDILRHPANSILTILVLAIALALPGIFYTMTTNAKALSGNWNSSMQMAVFIKDSASEEQAKKLVSELLSRSELDSVSLRTKEEVLQEFKTYSGFSDALELLDENPMPMEITIIPNEAKIDPSALPALVAELEANPIVDSASLDMEWVNKYQAILKMAEKIGSFISLLLGISVLLIVGNTIRLAILNRREEIQVIKLVGATDAFIRRPFLYTGFWYGLMAGIIAALMISILSNLVGHSASRLAELYQSNYQLLGLAASQIFTLIAIGSLLGLVGAWISVRKHLKEIQPT